MNKCSECGATQPKGTMFCDECGNALLSNALLSRAPVQREAMPFSRGSRHSAPLPLAERKLSSDTPPRTVTFVVPGSRNHLKIELKEQAIIGRSDAHSDVACEIDLTEYGGLEMGVSRVHASLLLTDQGVCLCDLGSTNGTLLNNTSLAPKQAFLLHNGDEIHFGDLLVHIFFEA